ncbi:hypothetical protein KG090_00540 [Carnobacteriaceae bacterium zg-ZUI240]|nr:hypothetical protein [Carnobacteriaceae bacterium zg-ZUI240]
MKQITNEQIIACTKRIVDDVPIIKEDVDYLSSTIRYTPNEYLEHRQRELVHELHAISVVRLLNAWDS